MNDVLEALCRAILELLFELALKGPGYLIVRCFHDKREFDPDGCLVIVLGICFWVVMGLITWGVVLLL